MLAQRQTVNSDASSRALKKAAAVVLQRKCACGTRTPAGGACEACGKNILNLQRRAADRRGKPDEIPSIVHEVLHSPSQPLDAPTRAFMEPRFGHDFSDVRVHTDARAAESARAVNALAYTVGRDMVFGAGQYMPVTSAGRNLLAHELTHVLQWTGSLHRHSIAAEPKIEIGSDDDEFEREARDVAREVAENDAQVPVLRPATPARLQRVPAIVGLDEAGPTAKLTGGEKEAELLECVKRTGPDPTMCEPSAPLTWGNFKGTPQVGSSFDASTLATVKEVDVFTQACMKLVLGKTAGPTRRFQSMLDSGESWVKPKYKDAADPAKNGCAKRITDCERFFDKEAVAKRVGGWQAMSSTPDANCPAGVIARGDKATSKAECVTKLGTDCSDRAAAESARLLKHEQGHFDISCEFAKNANAALVAGGDLGKIKKTVDSKLGPTQTKYDKDTNHGCKAADQSRWEAEIAGGLKTIAIP